MTTNTLKKVLAGSALAAMLVPMAASAHGLGLNLGGGLNLGIGDRTEKTGVEGNGTVNVHANAKVDNDNDGDKNHQEGDRGDNKAASTTAATIVKKANRISTVADLFSSMSATLGTKIAGSASTTDKAALNAKLGDFNTATAGAKTQAAAAVTAAGNIDQNASSTVNASFVTAAQADLKAARDFLNQARLDISFILHAIWK